jgi:hypothetical protein
MDASIIMTNEKYLFNRKQIQYMNKSY